MSISSIEQPLIASSAGQAVAPSSQPVTRRYPGGLEEPEARAFIAIGSNIEPERHITLGLDALARLPATRVGAISSWYRTRPWGLESQAEFRNLVVEVWTHLAPSPLLTETQAIEARLGRVRQQPNGPRTLDLDILLHGERVDDVPGLRIPHPGLLVRDFMLIPLLEIAPEVIHPEHGRSVAELTGEIRYRQIIERLQVRG